MIASRVLPVLILAGVAIAPAFAQEASGRFAKVFEVTSASVHAEPGEDLSTITVEAAGAVNTGGWSGAELAAWSYIGPPADGILDFDLMAKMPPDDAMVTMALEEVSASVTGPMPPWVRGIRVHASSNSIEVLLDSIPSQPDLPEVDADGNVLADEVQPWPWKFFTPMTMIEHPHGLERRSIWLS